MFREKKQGVFQFVEKNGYVSQCLNNLVASVSKVTNILARNDIKTKEPWIVLGHAVFFFCLGLSMLTLTFLDIFFIIPKRRQLKTPTSLKLDLPTDPGCWLVTTRMTAETCLGSGIPT